MAVDRELFDFLALCLRWSRESGGAFDVTVAPLMMAWGFFRGDGRVPAEAEIADARALVGASHVVLDAAAGTVRFDRAGVALDLGGIGKGYAVDRAVAVLRARGIASALVNAGGSSVYGLGGPPGGERVARRARGPRAPRPHARDRAPARPRALGLRRARSSRSRRTASCTRT